ncbi:MAG: HlyD family type I secretion periplasmic adaptor subunit [Rickettsiales bacterium]
MLNNNNLSPMGQLGQQPKKQNIFIRFFNKVLTTLNSFVVFVDKFVNFMVARQQDGTNEVIHFTQRPIRIGTYIIIIFVFGGGLWAATAPLDSAATAIGTVMYSGHRKVVQYQEGGIVQDILVKVGDVVKKDDIIIKMDDTRQSARFLQTQSEYRTLLAKETRLLAEKEYLFKTEHQVEFEISEKNKNISTENINNSEIEDHKIVWSEILTEDLKNNFYAEEIKELIKTQTNTFLTKKAFLLSSVKLRDLKISQLELKIANLQDRKKQLETNISLLKDRTNSIKKLLNQGAANKEQFAEALMKQIETESQLQSVITEIDGAKAQILEAKSQFMSQREQLLDNNLKELGEVQTNLYKAREAYRESKDSLEKTIVKATASGVVNELGVYTIGSVIGQGTVVAEISPSNEGPLRIEAKIAPKDITNLAEGQKVKIKFSAFNSRTSPTFIGKLTTLSEDVAIDKTKAPAPGQDPNYYLAIIDIDFDSFKGYEEELKSLRPGLQAEVGIVYGSRTLLSFLLTQLSNQMFRSLNER